MIQQSIDSLSMQRTTLFGEIYVLILNFKLGDVLLSGAVLEGGEWDKEALCLVWNPAVLHKTTNLGVIRGRPGDLRFATYILIKLSTVTDHSLLICTGLQIHFYNYLFLHLTPIYISLFLSIYYLYSCVSIHMSFTSLKPSTARRQCVLEEFMSVPVYTDDGKGPLFLLPLR